MLTPRIALARRVAAAFDASPARIPVLLGGCGSGRSTLLRQMRERIGRPAAQYVDVERTATTPERFLRAITAGAPLSLRGAAPPRVARARGAVAATPPVLSNVGPTAGGPAALLVHEFPQLR